MRKSATPKMCVQRRKLKKHNKISKRSKFSFYIFSEEKKSGEPSILNFINVRDFKNKKTRSNSLNLPSDFSIFSEPEKTLQTILIDLPKVFYNNKVIKINHGNVSEWSLGSEVLMGIVTKDIKFDLIRKNKRFSIDGETGDNLEYKQLLASIGVIKDIEANIEYQIDDSPEIHVFEENGFHSEAPSAGSNDKKQVAVNGFIKYIEQCLKDHRLALSEDAESDIKSCLSEVLDNAIEHHGEEKPNWRIRGFLSNKHERRTLEITVLNFGKSIPDTFHSLPKDHLSRLPAFEYVGKHVGRKMSIDQLLTVWALQGGQSSKNVSEDDTRGIGTVNLIEAFENIFQSYIALREQPVKSECKMNIITGNIVVHFDGKYNSKELNFPDGSQRVIIPFNKSESLESPPDRSSVRLMGVSFPGVMINISLPLKGSVTPLNE